MRWLIIAIIQAIEPFPAFNGQANKKRCALTLRGFEGYGCPNCVQYLLREIEPKPRFSCFGPASKKTSKRLREIVPNSARIHPREWKCENAGLICSYHNVKPAPRPNYLSRVQHQVEKGLLQL